jgi:hypothetical protein
MPRVSLHPNRLIHQKNCRIVVDDSETLQPVEAKKVAFRIKNHWDCSALGLKQIFTTWSNPKGTSDTERVLRTINQRGHRLSVRVG